MIILIIIRHCFFVFFFPESKLKGKLWIPLVLKILSEDARRGVLNCLFQKVLMRTEAGRDSFFLFPFSHFFFLSFLKVRLFLVLPGVSLCSNNQQPMVHRDGKEQTDGHLLNIQIMFPVFKTGEGWCQVGGGNLNFFFWSKDKWSCFPCVENGMDAMLNFRFSLYLFLRHFSRAEGVCLTRLRDHNV